MTILLSEPQTIKGSEDGKPWSKVIRCVFRAGPLAVCFAEDGERLYQITHTASGARVFRELFVDGLLAIEAAMELHAAFGDDWPGPDVTCHEDLVRYFGSLERSRERGLAVREICERHLAKCYREPTHEPCDEDEE